MNKCELCGEDMPEGEKMFNYHGFSGPCPRPPLRKAERTLLTEAQALIKQMSYDELEQMYSDVGLLLCERARNEK